MTTSLEATRTPGSEPAGPCRGHAVVRHGRLRHLIEVEVAPDAVVAGADVVIETSRGLELGQVLLVSPAPAAAALGRLVRVAMRGDLARARDLAARAARDRAALDALIAPAGLHVVAAERLLGGLDPERGDDLLVAYYEAAERVDVPGALRRAEVALGLPIDLVQLGARQRARACGGAGVCGRSLCCSTFLRVMEPVTLRMAKVQGVTLSPETTAGACGRLKCCLRYENPVYEASRRGLPRVGWIARSRRATGIVLAVDVVRRRVLIRPTDQPVEGGRAMTLLAGELDSIGPAPRTALPRAGAAGPPPAPPPERGWSDLARRILRRVSSGRVPRPGEPPSPPPQDGPSPPS